MPSASSASPEVNPQQRYRAHEGSQVEHFSNTSEDAYGLEGAFANIADSIDRANDYIFIAGWMFEPWLHLPAYGEHLRRGLACHHKGDLDGAITQYKKILDGGLDNNGYAAFFLARAYYKQGNRELAKEVLIEAIKKNPTHKDLAMSLAKLHLEDGHIEEAEALVEPWLNAQDLDALSILAECYKKKGEYDKAKNVYETILRLDPLEKISKARHAYQGLGDIFLQQNEYSQAEEQYRKCLWFSPQDVHSLIGLAQSLRLNPEKSKDSVNQIDICYFEAMSYLQKQPDHEQSALYKRTRKEYALWAAENITITNEDQFDSYLQLIEHAIELNPADPQLFLARVDFLLKNTPNTPELRSQFITECEKQLEQHPENMELHRAIIQLASQNEGEEVRVLNHKMLLNILGLPKDKINLPPTPSDRECVNQAFLSNPDCIEDALRICNLKVEEIPDRYAACLLLATALNQIQFNPEVRKSLPPGSTLLTTRLALINKIKALGEPLKNQEDALIHEGDLRTFNIMDFDEGMRQYRDTLPSLGETLIRKALANPEMVIAINLWQQFSAPNDPRRYKHPIQELKKIAEELGLPFPQNILIRTNHCRDFLNSHHQKYILMDDGRGSNTGYVGSCDLSGKFEWADHPIINTQENDNAVDRHYRCNDGESMRQASYQVKGPDGTESTFNIPRGPWREVISKVKGLPCQDLLQEFQTRWLAKSGGTLSGYSGADDDFNLVGSVGTTVTYGSPDFGQKVRLKIDELFNKIKIYLNKSSWSESRDKYEALLKSIPGDTIDDKNKHPLMTSKETQTLLKQLYRDAFQHWALCKNELIRIQKKYPEGHPRRQEAAAEVLNAKAEYRALIANHLSVSPDAQKQLLDEEEQAEDASSCCTRIICSSQKSYYKSKWQLASNVDSSIQEAYVQAIKNAEHFVYIENQYFTCDHTKIDSNPIVKAMLDKIIAKAKAGEPFHIHLNLPYSPNGEPGGGVFVDPVRKTQLEVLDYMMKTIERETGKSWSDYLSVNFFAQWQGVVDAEGTARLTDKNAISRAESQSLSQRAPIYNHSKLMIVDGNKIINGSANITERSMSGKSDTELAIIQTPSPGKPESRKKMELFQLKIVRQYYGDAVADAAQARLDKGLDLGLGDPEIVAMIKHNSWENLASFSSNEPGERSSRDRGYVVSFPYKREFGHAGEVEEQFQYIPDAPRDKAGNTPDSFRWVPEKELSPTMSLARSTGKTT